MSVGNFTSLSSAAVTKVTVLPKRANTPSTQRFLSRALIIQREQVNFCAVRTFPNEASILHAIEGDFKDCLFLLHARKVFATRFQQKIARNIETRKIFEKLIADQAQHYCKGEKDTTLTRNAALIFQQAIQVVDADKAAGDKSEKYVEAYSKACLKQGYCFTRLDFPLIADIFERNLSVYSRVGTHEADFGSQYKKQVVLVESHHKLEDAQNHPIYTRYIPQTILESLHEKQFDRYTAPEINRSLKLHNNLTSCFNRQSPLDIFQSIFDYANIPFELYVNEGMQAVLQKEEWNIIVQSFQNWNFVQTLQRQVTHLCCPPGNAELIKRVKHIACNSLFPRLNSIQFSPLRMDDYLAILAQNPQCRSVIFEAISIEDLNTIFLRLPDLARQLTALTVSLVPNKSKQGTGASGKASSIAEVTMPQVLKSLVALQGLSIMFPRDGLHKTSQEALLRMRDGLDKTTQEVLLSMPNLYYLDLNVEKEPENRTWEELEIERAEFVKAFINKTRTGITVSSIDISYNSHGGIRPVELSCGTVTIKNYIQKSTGTFLSNLCTGRSLLKFNASGVTISIHDLRSKKNFLSILAPTVRYLDLSDCCPPDPYIFPPHPGELLLEIVSTLTQLEYLDLTGCVIPSNHIPLLASLTNLRILNAGNFICYTDDGSNSSEQSFQYNAVPSWEFIIREDNEISLIAYVQVIRQALPKLEKLEFKPVKYRINEFLHNKHSKLKPRVSFTGASAGHEIVHRRFKYNSAAVVPYSAAAVITPTTAPPFPNSSTPFGAEEWKKYFGEIGKEPPLPPNINQILKSPCPYFSGKTVEQTHMLVLIPETLNGQPLTLTRLGQIMHAHDSKLNKSGYNNLHHGGHGDKPFEPSHWVLMTRKVLEESKGKSYSDQQTLIALNSKYQVPKLSEATVCIYMEYVQTGQRLYSNSDEEPWTWTRCQERYGNGKQPWQMCVGGFAPEGLDITLYHDVVIKGIGVSALWKL